jgi:hypothetical protein
MLVKYQRHDGKITNSGNAAAAKKIGYLIFILVSTIIVFILVSTIILVFLILVPGYLPILVPGYLLILVPGYLLILVP